MYFNIKCIGKLPGPMDEFERSLVFQTGEFERPKFDCSLLVLFQFFAEDDSIVDIGFTASQIKYQVVN